MSAAPHQIRTNCVVDGVNLLKKFMGLQDLLRSRIIPCRLPENGGLTKTVDFMRSKYIDAPTNAIRINNEKEIGELVVLDINATVEGREPDYGLIENLAAESRQLT